jgi:hypothetical protein
MAAMKSFFEYGMVTICGIPWIELRGTLNDWIDIRDRSQRLFGEFMPEYAALLIPVLDQFVASYQGQVDHFFWQIMVKIIEHGRGSGSYSTVSGWINLLYPYLEKGNNKLKSWQEMESVDGPQPYDFPLVVSSVPVEWDFVGEQHLFHIHAGMFGMAQDQKTKALSTNIGWIVTRDPPQKRADRILAIENELDDYLASGQDDGSFRYWIQRLIKELEYLRNPAKRIAAIRKERSSQYWKETLIKELGYLRNPADRIVAIEEELNKAAGKYESKFKEKWIKSLTRELECLRN